MKLLITGGCGFLGLNIAASYLEEDAEVVVVDALLGSGRESNLQWLRGKVVSTVMLRHSSIYGGRQFSTVDQGWIGSFCRKALEQKIALDQGKKIEPFTIQGTGKQVRDVLHAEDLMRLYRNAYNITRRSCR